MGEERHLKMQKTRCCMAAQMNNPSFRERCATPSSALPELGLVVCSGTYDKSATAAAADRAFVVLGTGWRVKCPLDKNSADREARERAGGEWVIRNEGNVKRPGV